MPDEYIWFGLTEKMWIIFVRYKIFTTSKVSTERKKERGNLCQKWVKLHTVLYTPMLVLFELLEMHLSFV